LVKSLLRYGYFCDFLDVTAVILDFQKKILVLTVILLQVTVPNFIKIGQTVAEMWRCNGFLPRDAMHPRY